MPSAQKLSSSPRTSLVDELTFDSYSKLLESQILNQNSSSKEIPTSTKTSSSTVNKSPIKSSFLDKSFNLYPSSPSRTTSLASQQRSPTTKSSFPPSSRNNFRSATSPNRPLIPLNLTSTPPSSSSPHQPLSPTSLNKPIPPGSPPPPSNRRFSLVESSPPPPPPSSSLPLQFNINDNRNERQEQSPKILPQILILERIERSRPSVQQSLIEILKERRIVLNSSTATSTTTTMGGGGGGGGRRGTIIGDTRLAEAEGGAAVGGSSLRARRNTGLVLQQQQDIAGGAGGGEVGGGGDKEWEGTFNLPNGFMVIALVIDRKSNKRSKGGDKKEGGAGGKKKGDTSWGGLSRYLVSSFPLSFFPITEN